MADTKRIAKNTMYMYIRMLFIMGVTLYTSRVVLEKLGVDDFSLYNVVGGIVGMLSFMNATLSTGTSRFITFSLGKNDFKQLNATFSTTFYTHLALGVIFVIAIETCGVWYLYNKLVVDPTRFDAAFYVFHISVISALIGIIQVPFTSLIMAHEDMNVYAYVGIFDALGRLLVVFLLCFAPIDKLIFYALLLTALQLIVALCYYTYCRTNYKESIIHRIYDKGVLKSLLSFSSWNVLANMSETLKMQGYLVLLNLFFQPFVVAAQTIGNQIASAMMTFVGNFRSAINPQIIKLYASEQYDESKRLTLSTTVLSFDLVLLLGLPSIFVMETIMDLWLVDVPQYAVVFTQYIIIQRIIGVFESAFYTPQVAAAKIKTNSIISTVLGLFNFLVLYIIYKAGGDVMWMQYLGIVFIALWSFIIKPVLLSRDVCGYNYSDFIPCFIVCFKVSVLSVIITCGAYLLLGNEGMLSSVLLFILSFCGVLISSFVFMDKTIREKIVSKALLYIRR